MISAQTIDKVRDLPILYVIQKYHSGTIKRSGANYVCECPFHNDSHPSFTISLGKNIARCFACDTTSTGINFVMQVRQLTYPEAIRTIANDFDIEIIETKAKERSREDDEKYKEMEALAIANSWAADWYHGQLLSMIEKHFPGNDLYSYFFPQRNSCFIDKEKESIAYIVERFKGNLELIKKFRIGYIPEGFNNFYQSAINAGYKTDVLIKAGLVVNKEGKLRDFFIFRPLIIPIHSPKGRIVGFTARQMPWAGKGKDGKEYPKYINTADTLIYKKGNILFGFDTESQASIRKADKVYLVEGNLDKTSLFHIGIKNVLTKSGTALTDQQIDNISRLTKNICLIDDGDGPGQLSMLKNGEKLVLAGLNVTVITLPDGTDPDSFFLSAEQFYEFEKENERDYIIDVRAIEEYNNANTIQAKKKVKEAIAELLLSKPKDERDEYINAIVKETESNKSDWFQAIKSAVFRQKNRGLNKSEEQEYETIQPDNSLENRYKHDFYILKQDKQGNPTNIDIDERKFLLKLKSTQVWEFEQTTIYFGFFTYSINTDEAEIIFVQLRDGKIKKVSINFIKKTFFQFVRLLKPYQYAGYNNEGREWNRIVTGKDIETLLIKKVTTLFEEKRLILFPDKKIEILQDSIDKHYTFFKNCYVVSTKDGYFVNDYENLKEGYVWDDAVLDRNFYEPKTKSPGIFEKFVHDISGNEWNLQDETSHYQEKVRYKALLIAGGYLLHNYTEMQRKAVILTQGRISEDDGSEGREGKTLFVESLGRYMLNKDADESKTYVYVPGKDLKSDDKHKWMDLQLNTTCVLYDDPPPYIQFEDLYNLAERAFKVEKKRQENLYVKARIFITTNRPLDRDSGSSKARSCVIELDSIYFADYTPIDKYGHYFFRDWKGEREEEWNKFSKYVLGTMLPEYFKANCRLLEPPSKNLYRNELLQKARRLSGNVEIVFWLDFLVKGDIHTKPYFKVTETYHSKDLLEKLLQERDQYNDEKKLKNNISKLLKTYFDKEGIVYKQDRDSKGTFFKILGGIQEYVEYKTSFLSDFFGNGGGYAFDDVDDPGILEKMTHDFNVKFNTRITTELLKQYVDEMSTSELPF